MDSKKILITLIISIITLMTMIGHVNAEDYTFTFTVNPGQVTANLGETVTVDLGIADIASDGINAIQGDLSYDESLFESVEIVSAGNNWTVSLNQENDNNLKGRFVISNMNSIKDAGVVALLRAKVKKDATVSTGNIYLKDVFSSYGTTETAKLNKTITVNIETIPGNNDTPSTEQPSTQEPTTQEPTTQTSNTKQNVSKSSKLPKAGLSSWMGIATVITIIGSITGYIKYKKIY